MRERWYRLKTQRTKNTPNSIRCEKRRQQKRPSWLLSPLTTLGQETRCGFFCAASEHHTRPTRDDDLFTLRLRQTPSAQTDTAADHADHVGGARPDSQYTPHHIISDCSRDDHTPRTLSVYADTHGSIQHSQPETGHQKLPRLVKDRRQTKWQIHKFDNVSAPSSFIANAYNKLYTRFIPGNATY